MRVCVCARVRVRALRSYLWLKLYKLEPLLLPWEQVLGGGGASSAYR